MTVTPDPARTTALGTALRDAIDQLDDLLESRAIVGVIPRADTINASRLMQRAADALAVPTPTPVRTAVLTDDAEETAMTELADLAAACGVAIVSGEVLERSDGTFAYTSGMVTSDLRDLFRALDRATRDLAAAQAAARQYFAALAEYAMWVDVSPPLPDTTRESREEARRRLQQAELTLRAASLPADAGAVGEQP